MATQKTVVLTTEDWLRTNQLVIVVRMSRPLTLRLWLGFHAMKLSAWLTGARVKVQEEHRSNEIQPTKPWQRR